MLLLLQHKRKMCERGYGKGWVWSRSGGIDSKIGRKGLPSCPGLHWLCTLGILLLGTGYHLVIFWGTCLCGEVLKPKIVALDLEVSRDSFTFHWTEKNSTFYSHQRKQLEVQRYREVFRIILTLSRRGEFDTDSALQRVACWFTGCFCADFFNFSRWCWRGRGRVVYFPEENTIIDYWKRVFP